MSKERKVYPLRPGDYKLMDDIGQGVSACVYRALCIPLNEVVAVKMIDLERKNSDLNNITREAQTMLLLDHLNILKAHCSFTKDHYLWVVMPYMAGGSFLNILKAAYSDGFEEVVIATVLRDVLRGIEYLHNHGHIHRDVKAGNVLVDSRGLIKLGDFGVSACMFDSGDRQRNRTTFVGTPYWMAPEVLEGKGYDFKADMWSFGIMALELAHGHAPFSKFSPVKVLFMTLQNSPPGLDYESDRRFSQSFKNMITMCLVKDPSKRPTARKLLKNSFFKQARSADYIARTILESLPPLGERIQSLQLKETDILEQDKMLCGDMEEITQSEYKKAVSAWSIDVDDLRTQAELLQGEESASEKESAECTKLSFEIGSSTEKRSPGMSPASYSSTDDMEKGISDVLHGKQLSDRIASSLRYNSNGSENEINPNVQRDQTVLQNGLNYNGNGKITFSVSSDGSDHDDRLQKMVNSLSLHEQKASNDVAFSSSKSGRFSTEHPSQNAGNCNGVAPQTTNGLLSETIPKSRPSGSEDFDTKSKTPVVQQKGRFKVTSEIVEFEKVPLSPILAKSHSVQTICQNSAAYLSSPPRCGPNLPGSAIFPHLMSILQSNFVQKDNILSLMKQLSSGESSATRTGDAVNIQMSTSATEKTLLELADEREKNLIQQVTDLQWRLICAQEELQALKSRNIQK